MQLATKKIINTRIKNIGSDDNEKASLKVDEANATAWVTHDLNKLSMMDESIGDAIMEEMMKQVQSTP